MGKAATAISECMICKDVEPEKHQCLIQDATTKEWIINTKKNGCPILAAKHKNKDPALCNDIPYLTTDPPEKYWGELVSVDEDEEEDEENNDDDDNDAEGCTRRTSDYI